MLQTVGDWLLNAYPQARRATLRQMLRDSRVRIGRRVVRRWDEPLAPDARVEVHERPRPPRSDEGLEIVFEDAHLLVVNKPAGLLTSTVEGERRPTLLAQVRAARPKDRIGLIHRLDRDASGLLIFSKTDLAYRSLKTQFFHHGVTRRYAAVVRGVPDPPAGRIESRLSERTDGTVHSIRASGRGELAITHYQVLSTANHRSLLEVRLETGRKHQIRVHLSERGHPIVGDTVYGPPAQPPFPLMLCAIALEVDHPQGGKRMTFQIETPWESY